MPSNNKARNRRAAALQKAGGSAVGFLPIWLPNAVAEFRGRLISDFQAQGADFQRHRLGGAAAAAARLGLTVGEGSAFTAGECLGLFALLHHGGEVSGSAVAQRLRASCRRRDLEGELYKEAHRFSCIGTTASSEAVTFEEALRRGVAGLGMAGKLAMAQAAAAAAAAEAAAVAAAAIQAAEAAMATTAVRRWRWQRIFARLVVAASKKRFESQLEHTEDMLSVATERWADACAEFAKDNYAHVVMGDFAWLDGVLVELRYWQGEESLLQLKSFGLHHFARYCCHRAAARTRASAKKTPKRRVTVAQREAQHALLLPSYLVPTAASAYTKPIEEIRSVRFGNLPLAIGEKQCAELRQAMRDFAVRHGAILAEAKKGDGNVFCPLRGKQTIGFGFLKCATPENAKLFLERIAELEHPLLVDPVTGVERELMIELAASESKSKTQMEAEKAAKKAAPSAISAESQRIVALMKADIAKPSAQLVPICLGAAAKAAKSAAADEAMAAMRAKVAAMFAPTLVDAEAPIAKTYAVSFAAMAAKPVVKPVEEIVDPFTVVIKGERWGICHEPGSELAVAQASLRAAMEAEVQKPILLAQSKRRAERKRRNKGKEAWEQEPDTDEE